MLLNQKDIEIINLLLNNESKTTTEMAHKIVGDGANYGDVHKMDVLCRKHLQKLLRLGLVKKASSYYSFNASCVCKGKIKEHRNFLEIHVDGITAFIPISMP